MRPSPSPTEPRAHRNPRNRGVAVDDALDPGEVGVAARVRGSGGEGEGALALRDGDDLAEFGPFQPHPTGPAGDAEAEVEVELVRGGAALA